MLSVETPINKWLHDRYYPNLTEHEQFSDRSKMKYKIRSITEAIKEM